MDTSQETNSSVVVVDSRALFHRLMSIVFILLTRPIIVCTSIFTFGFKAVFLVVETWAELVKASIIFHLNMFHKTIIWMIALITLPVRVSTAMQRERLLQEDLHEMQIQLERNVLERKRLCSQLHTTTKKCRILEAMLAEIEAENDGIIAKIKLLEKESQDLKVENLRLKELLGKKNIGIADTDNYDVSDGGISRSKQSGKLVMHTDSQEATGKSKWDLPNITNPRSMLHNTASKNINDRKSEDQIRDVAVSQTLFSAAMSLLVGFIIWKAEDPCIPLVIGLTVVVLMSLSSVVQYFSSTKHNCPYDAVALLSFNWFILGMLACPTLPRLVNMLAQLT
ncbi:uncharacterized protein [Euphorbia lathyris]